MSVDVYDDIERIRVRHQWKVEQVRADASRTEDWRREELARIYLQIKSDLDRTLQSADDKATARTRTLESKVFGVSTLAGDPGSLAISRRDAADRAEQLRTQSAALELFRKADRYGDEPLTRAVVQKAVDNGWDDVVDAFAESRPDLADPLGELWQSAGGRGRKAQFGLSMHVNSLKPQELSGMNDFAIADLAGRQG